jgi:hypothetical protein
MVSSEPFKHYSSVHALGPYTKQPGLIYLSKKAQSFERSCALSQDRALGPVFEGDKPH